MPKCNVSKKIVSSQLVQHVTFSAGLSGVSLTTRMRLLTNESNSSHFQEQESSSGGESKIRFVFERQSTVEKVRNH